MVNIPVSEVCERARVEFRGYPNRADIMVLDGLCCAPLPLVEIVFIFSDVLLIKAKFQDKTLGYNIACIPKLIDLLC